MPVFVLTDSIAFPPPQLAEEGLLAVGGDLTVDRLLSAYEAGIFPWYLPGDPILWWSPDPRLVLFPNELHVSRRLARTLRQGRFRVSFDTAFSEVIQACASTARRDQDGTWITDDMIAAYSRLHELGYAHSVETWLDNTLVGGLYGISLGHVFFGESMFSRAADASKVALVGLTEQLKRWDVRLIDCQVTTPHMLGMGAREIERTRFLELIKDDTRQGAPMGKWTWMASD
ncbi:MAG TPA: leucyl/phenylalanyl-tRNA--protein transferase [Candidatus Hydrogenedentes bacterium]|nr:leucyl/phenylalanyl-tRNA--protein transferase [Candidatus Hydrogenedentota bacterium]HPG70063.1 leucyl/phenylalanyl-tRNA--protein transferase [Candidatus Hydrogenedentota bacterium]